jgi:hypothetical protein
VTAAASSEEELEAAEAVATVVARWRPRGRGQRVVWRPRGSGPERRLKGGGASGAQLPYDMEVTRRQAGSWRDACEELRCGERFWATSAR